MLKQDEQSHLKERAKVLIVDDQQVNIEVILELIGDKYAVSVATTGMEAIKIAENYQPDVILLDIIMPQMDGFAVCNYLKNNAATKDIPIIFLTASDQEESIVKGFNLGAVDYITKPFLPTELLARIHTHLTLKMAIDKEKIYLNQIRAYNKVLTKIVLDQDEELKHSYNQLSVLDDSKDEFLSLITHELRTPMNGLLAPSSLMFPKDRKLSLQEQEAKAIFEKSYSRLLEVVDEACILTEIKVEGGNLSSGKFKLQDEIQKLDTTSEDLRVQIADLGNFEVSGSARYFQKALSSIIEIAMQFSDKKKPVSLRAFAKDGKKIISISSYGYSIPEAKMSEIFKTLAIARPLTPAGNLGLKPAVGDQIIRLFGGTLKAVNLDEPGVEFIITF